MMATKNQHYVPRVYLKAWETTVETTREPQKKFNGIYYFKGDAISGEGSTREAILWKPHLYTISFRQLYLAKKCSRVHRFFADAIYDSMRTNSPQPVYGKLNHSIIRTKDSVRKHLFEIENWDFYYDDGTVAKKNALLNRFNDIRCYILEDSFSSIFEAKWESIMTAFVNEVKASILDISTGNRLISEKTTENMLEFFFMMYCRSPQFDGRGVYTKMKDILKQSLGSIKDANEIMDAIWFAELYRMFFKENDGFFHTVLAKAVEKCQIILFEAYPEAGTFITSDNPAFEHTSLVETTNMNGYYFPISPQYMLLIGKGNCPINAIDYRMADRNLVKMFNRLIASHSNELFVSTEKKRNKVL